MFELDARLLSDLPRLVRAMNADAAHLPDMPATADVEPMLEVLGEVARRMRDNYPYPHALYAGQMLKPPHPVARLAYTLALWMNPNNHALDGGRASSAMEKEAVAALAQMVGWDDTFLGHLTSGGTVANLEALYVAGRLAPGKRIVASHEAHYTHQRLTRVLGLAFDAIEVDTQGVMDMAALDRELARGDVGTVVVTLGTTGVGAIDPLHEILERREQFGFRVHVDAAYGGYFALCQDALPAAAANAFAEIGGADSIVIDPHKHGLQPYGCGCVLFRDPSVSKFYAHGSPYTYFSSDELHLGEISLECSRAGASAVALWATQRLLPMTTDGTFADGLRASLAAARDLHARLDADAASLPLQSPALDIVVWVPRRATTAAISAASQAIFEAAAQHDLHLATLKLPVERVAAHLPDIDASGSEVLGLRSVLMKPEHASWVANIWERYQQAVTAVVARGI